MERQRFVGLIRTSTTDQLLGLENQRQKIMSYCETYNLELVDIVVEQASGNAKERPLLELALSKLADVDGLIVFSLCRLTRASNLMTLIDKHFRTKRLVIVNQQIDTSTATGLLIINILGSINSFERNVLSERTIAALSVLKRNGKHLGCPTFGRDKNGTYLADEMKAYRKMIAMRKEGNTFQNIANALNAKGYRTKRNKMFSTGSVSSYLNRHRRECEM